jgi:hypothetical protein
MREPNIEKEQQQQPRKFTGRRDKKSTSRAIVLRGFLQRWEALPLYSGNQLVI